MSAKPESLLPPYVSQKTDLLATLRSETIYNMANYWNTWLRKVSVNGKITQEHLNPIERNLNHNVLDSINQEVVVSGDVYHSLGNGSVAPETISLEGKQLVFGGFTMMPFVNDFYPVARLYDPEAVTRKELIELLFVEKPVKPEDVLTTYYAMPELLTRLESADASDEAMAQIIADMGALTANHLKRRRYKQASLAGKLDQLRAIEQEVRDELRPLEGTFMSLQTTSFIGRYDGMDMPLHETITNLAQDYFDHGEAEIPRFVPHGRYIRAVYIELEEYGEEIVEMLDQSPLTHGVPCLELRDDLLQATYFVPMDEINDVEFGKQKREWWPAWGDVTR